MFGTRIQFSFVLLFFFVFGAANVFAKEVVVLVDRITDSANVLTEEDKKEISKIVGEIESETSAQIFLYTIQSLDGENIEYYSFAVAETSGIGQKGKDNGVLVLLSKGDRKVRIEVGYGLEDALTDVYCNRIIRNVMIPEFKAGNLSGGLLLGILSIRDVINSNIQNNPNLNQEYPNGIVQELLNESFANQFVYFIIIAVVSLILFVILLDLRNIKNKTLFKFIFSIIVFLILLYFSYQVLLVFALLLLLGGNLYLFYAYHHKWEYVISIISIFVWVPIFLFLFNFEFQESAIFVTVVGIILLLIKLANDEVVTRYLNSFAKKLGTGLGGLFFHLLGCIVIFIAVSQIVMGYHPYAVIFSMGLSLGFLYGFGYKVVGYTYKPYLIVFILWVIVVNTLRINFFDHIFGNEILITNDSLFDYGKVWFFLVVPFRIAKDWEVDSWKTRSVKYLLIALIWKIIYSLDFFLGLTNDWYPYSFFLFYLATFVIHFFVVIANESGSGGSSSSSSYSSSSGYSSSSYSSSSSSSSGGGGGSFGGGGSSGSW
ncbi:TPM domain-containing protein [Leptospira sp. 96542]|nr:TPM domain-containing protein [Leptospira sp. 96542]